MNIDVKIPCKSHVRKYLCKKYGNVHTVTKNSHLGSLVHLLLTDDLDEEILRPKGADFFYPLRVGEYYFNTRGHSVQARVLHALSLGLEILFREEMCTYIDIRVRNGQKALQALREFLRFYGINEEDARLDSLYKVYQRHCDRENIDVA